MAPVLIKSEKSKASKYIISIGGFIHERYRVEKDVLLLRNRVRMLQMEHEKAVKKINETQKKAVQLQDLK
jgi:hypothetical protein